MEGLLLVVELDKSSFRLQLIKPSQIMVKILRAEERFILKVIAGKTQLVRVVPVRMSESRLSSE